jgi:hypothetical protein
MLFARRPLSPWILGIVFTLCAVAVPLTCQLLSPPAAPPRTLTELTERLHRAGLSLDVVPLTDNSPEKGLYLCERPQPREQLQRLRRAVELGDRWNGIVFCEMNHPLGEVDQAEWERWGEYGMQLGLFVFFGDPALLRRIRQTVPEL